MARRELKAEDIYPLVETLSPEEQTRLAYYALRIRAGLTSRASAARWDPERMMPTPEEDEALAQAGLAAWADELDREDRT